MIVVGSATNAVKSGDILYDYDDQVSLDLSLLSLIACSNTAKPHVEDFSVPFR